MSTKQATFDVPETDPWKDEDTLRGLYHDDDLNQTEIAEYFQERGHSVSPSNISYWMGKFEIETSHTDYSDGEEQEKPECINYEDCGNETVGPKNEICDSCLDEARQKDRENQ